MMSDSQKLTQWMLNCFMLLAIVIGGAYSYAKTNETIRDNQQEMFYHKEIHQRFESQMKEDMKELKQDVKLLLERKG